MMNICRQISRLNHYVPLSASLQQIRTKVHVTVLKRKYPVEPHKKGFRPRPLGHKGFVYEVVSHATEGKEEPLELILTQFVEGLGKKGEKVQVKAQFGYNELLLPKKAVYATPENEELYCSSDPNVDSVFSSKQAPRTLGFISNAMVDVSMNKEQPWTIQPWHIRAAARKSGIIIRDDSCIEMPPGEISGPDLSLENKEFLVTLTLNKREKVKMRCRIHHWSTEPGERIMVSSPWFQKANPVFPEQADALQEMKLPVYVPRVKTLLEYK